jgi:hypothetical protein
LHAGLMTLRELLSTGRRLGRQLLTIDDAALLPTGGVGSGSASINSTWSARCCVRKIARSVGTSTDWAIVWAIQRSCAVAATCR